MVDIDTLFVHHQAILALAVEVKPKITEYTRKYKRFRNDQDYR
jgi:hypothetical protein